MLNFIFNNKVSEKKYGSDLFRRFFVVGLKEARLEGKNIGISINLVGEGKIRELNKKYCNKDKVTDVLSFPIQSLGLNRAERAKRLEVPPSFAKGKSVDLGDIFICLSVAKKRAKSENIDIERMLAWLTVHGFLHLLGYDHEKSEKDEAKMVALEKKIFKRLKIKWPDNI